MTEPAPRRGKRSLPYLVRVVGVLGAVVVGLVVAAKMGFVGNGSRPAAAAAPAASAAPSQPVAGQIGEGRWFVGADVQPGTYRSTGAVDGRYCMWSRHSSVSGGPMNDIIASDGSQSGQMVVTIEAGDKLFRTAGCAPFTKV